jgi:hypothetical protein
MNLQENIRRILREEISAKEAYGSYGSIKTIIDGKRDVAFIELNSIINRLLISLKSLKKIKVPSSTETNYIVYREGSEKEAQELYDIAMKYGGSLSYVASEEDSRRIGQILGYKKDEIEDYIKHNKKIRGITENIQRIREMMGINESSFLRRRVDVNLLDDEFIRYLNYITNYFLKKLDDGEEIEFYDFKRRIIDGLMDNFHDELSNWGLDEFQYDEIYDFLLERYLPKIESRYNSISRL